MTTDTDNSINAADVYHRFGRLEDEVSSLKEGQRELSARLDSLFYLVIGIGGAVIASVFASHLLGG